MTARDRGSFTIEFALLVPTLLFFFLLVLAAGRIETAHGAVDAAARDGARSASLSRDVTSATSNAQADATAMLKQQGVKCHNLQPVTLDPANFAPRLGRTGQVTVTVSCDVPLSDIAFLSLPGSVTVTGRFTSVVDAYRAR